jgi:hypothetical protein
MRLPQLRQDQFEILAHPAHTKTLSCGRRWGKTVLGGTAAGLVLANHGKVAWVAPNYKNSRPLWRWVQNATALDVRQKKMRINMAERTIETRGGGMLAIYSGDNIDSMRGEWFHLVVADEAARLPELAYQEVIMPTVADVDGYILLISTPSGRNWFWEQYTAGEVAMDEQQASWMRPTCDNPMPTIRRAYDKARRMVSHDVFAQEWDAQFSEAGMVFRHVREAAVLEPEPYQPGNKYVVGVDVGNKQDYTVATAINIETKKMANYVRINQLDWEVQADAVARFCKEYHSIGTMVESNGIGDPFIEMLAKRGTPVFPWVTTNVTKYNTVSALQAAFDHHTLQILDDKQLIRELEGFESDKTSGGNLRFNAPEGADRHDDMVISLCLAWEMARHDHRVTVHKGRI